jgi:hypothetical protein
MQNTRQEIRDRRKPAQQDQVRVTATEMIDGVKHLLVLERDETGCYREVVLEPVQGIRERQPAA